MSAHCRSSKSFLFSPLSSPYTQQLSAKFSSALLFWFWHLPFHFIFFLALFTTFSWSPDMSFFNSSSFNGLCELVFDAGNVSAAEQCILKHNLGCLYSTSFLGLNLKLVTASLCCIAEYPGGNFKRQFHKQHLLEKRALSTFLLAKSTLWRRRIFK